VRDTTSIATAGSGRWVGKKAARESRSPQIVSATPAVILIGFSDPCWLKPVSAIGPLDYIILYLYYTHMSIGEEAKKVLQEAENALRDLIARGAKEQRYREIIRVANLADGVARLHRGEASSQTLQPNVSSTSSLLKSKKTGLATARKSRSARHGYPRFERDGNRLVKLGWSKKNKKEYEHRVPQEVVISFVRHLGDTVADGKIFDVESLLPVQDVAGEEIPAYQVYVTLAWLRTMGVVEKMGKDGYVIRDTSLIDGGLDKLWGSVPVRSV
jgi:hypothetical protein